jgi:protoporphyrinogen oxidase
LTAAYELVKNGLAPLVLEKSAQVGGIALTHQHRGYRYDIGGHRFFTKVPEVQKLWNEVLGSDFIKVPRLSRIHFRGRFFNYPIELWNAFSNLGVRESVLTVLSYLKSKWRPYPLEGTFEHWVTSRFGKRLYQRFFRTCTEKVWGIPCDQIRADWAAQRIRGLSRESAVTNALLGGSDAKTLIKEFHYPTLGPGMMWERFHDLVRSQGGKVRLETDTVSVVHDGDRVINVICQHQMLTAIIEGGGVPVEHAPLRTDLHARSAAAAIRLGGGPRLVIPRLLDRRLERPWREALSRQLDLCAHPWCSRGTHPELRELE